MSEIRGVDFVKEVLSDKAFKQHGVKGMRWGFRRDSSSGKYNVTSLSNDQSSQLSFPEMRTASSKLTKSAKKDIIKAVDKLNESPIYKNANLNKDSKLQSQYFSDLNSVVSAGYMHAARRDQTKKMIIRSVAVVTAVSAIRVGLAVASVGLVHSADDPTFYINLKPTWNSTGHLTDYEEGADDMVHSNTEKTVISGVDFVKEVLSGEAFQQYGVPGMRWGRRKSRSSVSGPSSAKAAKVTKVSNTFHNKPKNRRMSDAELRSKVNRLQLEKQLKDLSAPSAQSKSFVRQVLEDSGKQAGKDLARRATTAGLQLALQAAVKNSTGSKKVFYEAMIAAGGKKK